MAAIVALIPARGGSKGLPGKNIRMLRDRPLIAYSIGQALLSRADRVVVSTDSDEIAAVARRYGAEVLRRPAALAADLTPDLPVFEHAIDALTLRPQDLLVHLRATSPLRTSGTINWCIDACVRDPECTAVRTVTRPAHTPFKMFYECEPYLKPLFEEVDGVREPINQPRQVLPAVVEPNGCVDVVRVSTILDHKSMTGPRIRPVLMERDSTVDIDTLEDFERAERLMGLVV